jgi:hypothetical protein
LLVSSALVLLIARMPTYTLGFFVSLPLVLVMYAVALGLQGESLKRHLLQGGRQDATWKAAVFGVLGAAVFFGIGLGGVQLYATLYNARWGKNVDFGQGQEVFYAKGATKDEARKLGQFLQRIKYFSGQRPASVQVARDGERYIVSFVLQPGAWAQPDVLASAAQLRVAIAAEVFEGKPVEVRLCDEELTPQRMLR